jgi:hypothetical protein
MSPGASPSVKLTLQELQLVFARRDLDEAEDGAEGGEALVV